MRSTKAARYWRGREFVPRRAHRPFKNSAASLRSVASVMLPENKTFVARNDSAPLISPLILF